MWNEQDAEALAAGIDELIARAKEGDTESIQRLLEMFQPIIQSYLRLALYGSVNDKDPIMVGFVCAYGKSLAEGAINLRDRLARNDPEDICQEIILTFLETVRKSPSNLQYAFRRDCVRKLGALARVSGRPILMSELDCCPQPDSEGCDDQPRGLPKSDGGFQESFELWILGDTSSPVFESLTERERQMLVDRYVYRLDRGELKRRYGKHVLSECRALAQRIRSLLFPE